MFKEAARLDHEIDQPFSGGAPDQLATKALPAKRASADFKSAGANGGLVPSWAHDMLVSPAVEGAFYDVLGNYWSSKDETAQQAADKLAVAAKTN